MVKGLSRRVIVVKSPDGNIFEEAIFIVKEDAAVRGVTQDTIIKEAQSAANDYLRQNSKRRSLYRLPPPVFAFGGAAITALVWILTKFI
ncbi:MAG: translation initiation factor 2 [Oscillospiraceae bacterium]